MKKIIIVLFLLLAYDVFSQSVEIDYSLKNPFKGKKKFVVNDGEWVNLIIYNVNPFLYKVSVTSTENSYNTNQNNLFKNYFVDVETSGIERGPEPISQKYELFAKKYETYKNFVRLYEDLMLNVHRDTTFKAINEQKNTIISGYSLGREKDLFENAKNCVKDMDQTYLDFKIAFSLSDKPEDNLKIFKENAEAIMTKLSEKKYESFPDDLRNLLSSINEENFNFKSNVLFASKDEVVFTLNVTAIDDEYTKLIKNQLKEQKDLKIPVEVVGGFKVDFSTGLYVTKLIDHDFVTVKDSIYGSTDTVHLGNRILRNSSGDFRLGFTALGHFYWRWFTDINFGLNFGAGYIQDQSLQYLGGFSIMFGSKQRFIINGGIVFGNVERLSKIVRENEFYEEVPLQSNYTIKEMEKNWYLGITYNLTE